MKNRTIIGIICIVIALVVTFAVAPLVNKLADNRTDIVRLTGDVVQGHMISDTDIEVVTVGSYNLPTDVITKKEDVLGKFAAVDLKKGDYLLPSTFICVYLYKSPVRMTYNEFLVVFLLQLIRRRLIRIAGRYADVHCHTLMCVIIIKIDLRLSGDAFNQTGINALITSSDLRLLLLF